jgi:ABC-type phosphate transport system auxiliary subunit
LSSDFDKLSSYHRVEGLDALSKRVNIRSDDASAAINSVERAYEALKALRDLLQKASHEEGLAKFRISTEMSELTAESKHITEELRFIQAEKEKIAAKAINEFQPIPFPELIDHEVGFTNVSWKEMYNRATYDNIYN